MINAVVIGAGGYTGAELASRLTAHPHAKIVGLFASARRAEGESRMSDLHPRLRGLVDDIVAPIDLGAVRKLNPDVVFLATPHEVSLELTSAIVDHDPDTAPVIIDLSAAFRLRDPDLYPKHYAFEHSRPDLLERAVYGMPELLRRQITSASLIAAPGCYPTSAVLPLAPLVRAGGVDRAAPVIVDSVSGASGAGRAATEKTHFCEISLQAYNVLRHRHTPEIETHAGAPVIFTPHLAAFERGILSTLHVKLANGWNADRVRETYESAYADETFVRLLPEDHWPSVAGVRHTNFCDLGWAVDESRGHLIIESAIDNLVKGASGQAIQCMNVRFGRSEAEGLR